jgi:hypothetical protein
LKKGDLGEMAAVISGTTNKISTKKGEKVT